MNAIEILFLADSLLGAEGFFSHIRRGRVPDRFPFGLQRSLYGQSLPPFGSSSAQNQPAALGSHPGPKPMCSLSLDVRNGCKRLFHSLFPSDFVEAVFLITVSLSCQG